MNMIITKKIEKENPGKFPGVTPELKTEGPLSEKDEQSQAIAGNEALQEEAMKIWNARKIGKPITGAKKN
jgi:hypothetical protein